MIVPCIDFHIQELQKHWALGNHTEVKCLKELNNACTSLKDVSVMK